MQPGELLGLDRAGMEIFFARRGEKKFRAVQLFRQLHQNGARDFARLTDFPVALRESLADEFGQGGLRAPDPVSDQASADGTRKLLFGMESRGDRVEAVLIPDGARTTLCISTQAGCPLACKFCLTGRQGFARNLSAAEIVAQLQAASDRAVGRITNVVMMGMGEPLLNLSAVLPALRIMTDPLGWALPPRRVTVSTAGIVPAMARLRAECPTALAVSLHAPDDDLRSELMPINRKYPLAELMDACRRHADSAKRAFVTFEYVMLDEVNDSPGRARQLIRILNGMRCKVNLIPFNPFPGTEFKTSPQWRIRDFRNALSRGGINTTIRRTRGDDILAACGQLAGEVRARRPGLAESAVVFAG